MGSRNKWIKISNDSLQDVLDEILTHVGMVGWSQCCWTEENMASKRLFPGHQFSARSRKWTPRLKVTEDSLRLMVRRVQALDQYQNQSRCDMAHMEGVAEKAAVLSSFAKEFCREHPIGMEVVEDRVLKPWAAGDDRIDMELHAALLDRNDDFEIVKHMPCFKTLLGDSLFKAPVNSAQEEVLRDALKRDEYDHLIEKLEYDVKVFEIWQQKCQGVTVARQHARQEHLVAQHKKCVQSVDTFVDGCLRFLTWESCKNSDALLPQILKFRLDAIKKMMGKEVHASEVPTVCLMNWSAPCLFPNNRQSDHMTVLNWALHDNANSVGVIFFPVFSTHKGKTFLEESTALSMLSRNGHNLDHQFSLLFADRCDQRDGRPLLYPARLAFPSHVVDLSKSAIFFHSELRKTGRTSEVKQITGKELKDIEDVAEDGLPIHQHWLRDRREQVLPAGASCSRRGPEEALARRRS